MSDPQNLLRLSALKSLECKEYGKALGGFLTLLSTSSYPISSIETDLVYAVGIYVSSLIELRQTAKAIWLWQRVYELANDKSTLLLYCYARFLFSIGELKNALEILQKCISIDPSHAAARETSEDIRGLIVDRWHFRMLNDRPRNMTYFQSIKNAVRTIGPECVVLDIGGGTGLLSIYAILAGCKHVYCCELNRDLAAVAVDCVGDYGPTFANKISIISKHSKDLRVGEALDLPERVDLIVTELVDSGLLGEHIIESLRDAKIRLLKEKGQIIPYSATVYGYPVECDIIAARQGENNKRNNSTTSSIFKDSFSCTASACVNVAQTSYFKSYHLEVDEHYTCESLTPKYPYKPLSSARTVLKIFFDESDNPSHSQGSLSVACASVTAVTTTSAENISCRDGSSVNKSEIKIQSPTHVSSPSSSSFSAAATAASTTSTENTYTDIMTQSGVIDGFAYWFDLHLERSEDLDCTVSTAPGRRQCGWDQAIIYGNKFQCKWNNNNVKNDIRNDNIGIINDNTEINDGETSEDSNFDYDKNNFVIDTISHSDTCKLENVAKNNCNDNSDDNNDNNSSSNNIINYVNNSDSNNI